MKRGYIADGKDAMLALRHDGLTNKQIAKTMGCSYSYVLSLIGKQPKELDMRILKTNYMPAKARKETLIACGIEAEEENVEPLIVEYSEIKVIGKAYEYSVNRSNKTVTIKTEQPLYNMIDIPFDKFNDFMNDVKIIARNLESQKGMNLDEWK